MNNKHDVPKKSIHLSITVALSLKGEESRTGQFFFDLYRFYYSSPVYKWTGRLETP